MKRNREKFKKYARVGRQNLSPPGQKEGVGQGKMTYAVSLPEAMRAVENLRAAQGQNDSPEMMTRGDQKMMTSGDQDQATGSDSKPSKPGFRYLAETDLFPEHPGA